MSKKTRLASNSPPAISSSENPRVSSESFFSDSKWNFSLDVGSGSRSYGRDTIDWDFDVTGGSSFLAPEYTLMLLAMKQLSYLTIFGSQQRKISTAINHFIHLRLFVRFLANRPSRAFRFQDVMESDVRDFIELCKERPGRGGKGKISALTIARVYVALNLLYEEKEYLADHLTFRASGNRTPYEKAGFKPGSNLLNKYQPVPDEELKQIIDVSLDYIRNKATEMLRCLREFRRFTSTRSFRAKSYHAQRYSYESQFFPLQGTYKSSSSLNAALIQLRSACFIIIAFSTGMRLSEIMSTKRGCIREEVTSNHGTFYWIDSKLYKTQGMRAGSDQAWMCGRLAAQAVNVLEQMGETMGVSRKTKYLFFAFDNVANVMLSSGARVKKLEDVRVNPLLKEFCVKHGIATNLHPHRLRRSFARNIIRYSNTSILALKEHFKHWSLYMTDWYVGLDTDLLETLEAERLLLSMEAAEKICTQMVGGPGGRRWTRELDERIRNGTLPRNFRGKAGLEFRKKMIQGIHESGMIVTPCGDFTNCVFQKDRALCTTKDYPIVNRCNPLDCSNSFILPENVVAYERHLDELKHRVEGLPREERKAPVGEFYLTQIRKVRRIIETFNKKNENDQEAPV